MGGEEWSLYQPTTLGCCVSGGQVVDIINERDGPLPIEIVLKIFYQACKAVQHLHKQSPPIIHRDLKVGEFEKKIQVLQVCFDSLSVNKTNTVI